MSNIVGEQSRFCSLLKYCPIVSTASSYFAVLSDKPSYPETVLMGPGGLSVPPAVPDAAPARPPACERSAGRAGTSFVQPRLHGDLHPAAGPRRRREDAASTRRTAGAPWGRLITCSRGLRGGEGSAAPAKRLAGRGACAWVTRIPRIDTRTVQSKCFHLSEARRPVLPP